ncbi:hypothetical protein C8R43DRAFT_952163 [Mycena crocata]|nr:hypothetical protein C8R43DRAFT_952163 [Mycena crocata]
MGGVKQWMFSVPDVSDAPPVPKTTAYLFIQPWQTVATAEANYWTTEQYLLPNARFTTDHDPGREEFSILEKYIADIIVQDTTLGKLLTLSQTYAEEGPTSFLSPSPSPSMPSGNKKKKGSRSSLVAVDLDQLCDILSARQEPSVAVKEAPEVPASSLPFIQTRRQKQRLAAAAADSYAPLSIPPNASLVSPPKRPSLPHWAHTIIY